MFNKVPPELRVFVTILIIGEQSYYKKEKCGKI